MPANVETMAYRSESRADVPWHGLGTPINHDATPEEMLALSGLDWTVSKRPLFAPGNDWSEIGPGKQFESFKDYCCSPNGSVLPIQEYFALVRDSDHKVLGPSGKEYLPIQNKQAFDFFKKFTDAGQMRMETAGSLQDGKQIWVLAKLKRSFMLPGNDEVAAYILLSSPHIWGRSFVIKFVTIRVVCMNTFTMAMGESQFGKGFRMPHIRAFDAEVARDAAVSLGIANELFEGFEATANKLAKTRVDTEVVVRYVADLYQPELIVDQFGKSFYKASEAKQAEMLMDPSSPKIDTNQFKRTAYDILSVVNRQPGADLDSAKGTLWGAFNATTYHSDHLAGRDRDNALYSAWFGPKAVNKSQALKRAVQMAEIASA